MYVEVYECLVKATIPGEPDPNIHMLSAFSSFVCYVVFACLLSVSFSLTLSVSDERKCVSARAHANPSI